MGATAVSIITASLPTRAHLLADAAGSVSAQTCSSAHLIGIDASRGVAEVRNALVRAARSEWVGFLDDDDLLDDDHVETLMDYAADADIIIPHCRFKGPALPDGYYNRPYDREELRAHGIFPITVLVRRDAVLDVGGFPENGVYEDWELWNTLADDGARFVVVPSVTWTYRTDTAERRTHALAESLR